MFRKVLEQPVRLLKQNRFYQHSNTSSFAHGIHGDPGLVAKRIIDCVGTRLRDIDPQRWEGVPITFKTHFRDEGGYTDIHTCIHIHDALEREFGFDIKDKKILVSDIETAFYVVINGHDTV